MSAVVFNYKCNDCNSEFFASGIPDFNYGEFVMRSALGYEAYLNAVENSAFIEVLGNSKITGESCSASALTPQRHVMSRSALMAGGSLRADNL